MNRACFSTRILVSALLSGLVVASAACAAQTESDLGSIDFPTSGSAEAHAHFVRGVAALHSFEYRDARAAFEQAREAEPSFAMATWGLAMTANHPIWLEEDVDSARAALERLAPSRDARRALAPTQREKDYLEAVEILFGEGDKRRRDLAYAEHLRAMTETYPDDLEARSFYALALLGTCHDGRDTATYMRAAAVVEEVFDRNPRHPGAAHYLIHAYDDPVHAPLGLRPARIYADIAPAAGHALHMPSHIFLALGMWDETVASNIDSWEAVANRVEQDGLAIDRHNYHALHWWHYAELQRGRYEEARRLLERMARDAETSGSVRTRSHLALMRAAHIVATGDDRGLPAGPDLDELQPSSLAAERFATGLAALGRDDLESARAVLADLESRQRDWLADDRKKGYNSGFTRVGPKRTASADTMVLQLRGMVALAGGDEAGGLALLGEALALESGTPFGFGPAMPVKPSHELLGETLLALDRHDEAGEQLREALARTPRRARALLAQARAASARGDAETADAAYASLRAVWHVADGDLPERAEAGLEMAPGSGSGVTATSARQ